MYHPLQGQQMIQNIIRAQFHEASCQAIMQFVKAMILKTKYAQRDWLNQYAPCAHDAL